MSRPIMYIIESGARIGGQFMVTHLGSPLGGRMCLHGEC